MIQVRLRFYGMRPETEEILEQLNDNNEIVLQIEDKTSLDSFLQQIHVERMGKLIRMNEDAISDFHRVLHNGDLVEIFKLHAGG